MKFIYESFGEKYILRRGSYPALCRIYPLCLHGTYYTIAEYSGGAELLYLYGDGYLSPLKVYSTNPLYSQIQVFKKDIYTGGK